MSPWKGSVDVSSGRQWSESPGSLYIRVKSVDWLKQAVRTKAPRKRIQDRVSEYNHEYKKKIKLQLVERRVSPIQDVNRRDPSRRDDPTPRQVAAHVVPRKSSKKNIDIEGFNGFPVVAATPPQRTASASRCARGRSPGRRRWSGWACCLSARPCKRAGAARWATA